MEAACVEGYTGYKGLDSGWKADAWQPCIGHTIRSMSNNTLPLPVLNLLTLKGQFVSFETSRPLKMLKGMEQVIKTSRFVARIGVKSDNIQAVKDKRESGELPAENQGLPWGSWVEGQEGYVITHKGQLYLRCSKVKGNDNCIPKSVYLIGEREISKEQAMGMAYAGEFTDK